MNSQSQKPSTVSKGGRSSAGVPPYAPNEKPGAQSFDSSGTPDKGTAGPSSTGLAGSKPPVGSPSFDSGGTARPVITPSFGGSDMGKPRGVPSLGASGSTDTAAAKPRQTGTEALIAETEDTLGKAAETVYAAADAAREASAQIADVAKEAFAATVSAVSAQAAELTSNITHELSQTAEAQKERGADAMHRFAKAIRTAADELNDGSPEIARQVRAAAGSVDSLSRNLHGKSIGDLFSAASDFARNQPAAFFAGAVIAGFAFSRFLKSSATPPALRQNGEREDAMPASMPHTGTGMRTSTGMGTSGVTPSAPSASSF
jgi:hypothetical protein